MNNEVIENSFQFQHQRLIREDIRDHWSILLAHDYKA